MSQFKHTPGPWSVHNGADIFTDLGAKNSEGIEAPSNDGWLIADCDMGGLHFGEVRANAHLIAAAPEMLEALIEADKTLCVLQSNVAAANKTDARWDGVWTELEHQRMAIQSVIAKVTGE